MRTLRRAGGLLALSLLFLSCTTGPEPTGAVDAGVAAAGAETVRPGPATRGSAAMELLRDTTPRDGVPLFAGFSPRLRDRSEEEEAALQSAAREVIRYQEVRASVVFIAQRSGRGVGYAEAIETRIDEDRVAAVTEGLELHRSVQDENGTVVLVSAPEVSAPEAPLAGVGTGGSPPPWIGERPRIPGYDVGVGVAGRLRSRARSVTAADEEALAEIVLERAARVRAVGDARTAEGMGTTERTTRAEEAADVVRGFYVLSRWRSADGRYYYSLAIARSGTPVQSPAPAE